MFYDYPLAPEGPRNVDTESIACAMVDRWSIRADISFARCTKGIVHTARRLAPVCRVDEVLLMALTFGTLLSSQGADAHRLALSSRLGGNLANTTRSDSHRQTAAPPVPATVGARWSGAAWCSGWPGFGLPATSRRTVVPNKENISQLGWLTSNPGVVGVSCVRNSGSERICPPISAHVSASAGRSHVPTSRTARRFPTATTTPSTADRGWSNMPVATTSPSIRTAPSRMSRRAALEDSARPLSTRTAGRCTGSPAGKTYSARSVCCSPRLNTASKRSSASAAARAPW